MGGTGVTWASTDTTIATVSGTDALGTVTALKAGSTTITATAGGTTLSVPLTVNSYSTSDRMAGATAFTTFSCASAACHGAGGPDISPSDIGKHTDAQILASVTMGANPEGGPISIGAAAHTFAITAGSPEARGISAYLRTLPPGTPVQDN
jgi:mono/diheme cytochrome c family protein